MAAFCIVGRRWLKKGEGSEAGQGQSLVGRMQEERQLPSTQIPLMLKQSRSNFKFWCDFYLCCKCKLSLENIEIQELAKKMVQLMLEINHGHWSVFFAC